MRSRLPAILLFALSFLALCAVPARADLLHISTKNGTYETQEAFNADFEFDTASNAVSNMVYQSSGTLGTFAFVSNGSFWFNWLNSAGDLLQIFDEGHHGDSGPLYAGQQVDLEMWCNRADKACSSDVFFGRAIISAAVPAPEPSPVLMTLAGMGLIGLMLPVARRWRRAA